LPNTKITGLSALTAAAGDEIPVNRAGADGKVTAAGIAALAGTPVAITVANEATDATCFPLFATAATGDLGPKSNAGLTFDSSTGAFGSVSHVLNADVILRRNAAANLALGAADAASPVAQTLSVQNVSAGTSNTRGADWTFQGSLGTGDERGGNIVFKASIFGAASGSSQNAGVTLLTVGTNGAGNAGVTLGADRVYADINGIYPAADNSYSCGVGTAFLWQDVRSYQYHLKDGVTAPSATVGLAKLYVDTSDGDLKVIFGDGTIKTIATDT
jgi:hypothetical protein